MTKQETIQVLQSIEDRAVDFPNMTACDWVAIAAAKRHLTSNPKDAEQYIPKSALVAEIEKCYNECLKRAKITNPDYWNAKADAYRNVLVILDDTIEVKGIDLEEKATQLSQKYFPDEENIWARPNIEAHRCKSACMEMVEWLKTQKGE